MNTLLVSLCVAILHRLLPLEESLSALILTHAKALVAEEGDKALALAEAHAKDIISAALDKADAHQAAVRGVVAQKAALIAKAVSPVTPEGAAALVSVATQSVVPSGV